MSGGGLVKDLTPDAMARMMIGDTVIRERAGARRRRDAAKTVLDLAGLFADDDAGRPAVDGVSLKIAAGEILGIAGVSGNGQAALVEVLGGPAPAAGRPHLHPRQAVRAGAPATSTASRCSACPRSR